jgi:large subunit ribosomal protein L19
MNHFMQNIEKKINTKKRVFNFNVGDLISIVLKIKNAKKEKCQTFTGFCIAKSGREFCKTFIVRKINSVGYVEKIFPLYSPSIVNIIVKHSYVTRRAKLYYLKKIKKKYLKLKHM